MEFQFHKSSCTAPKSHLLQHFCIDDAVTGEAALPLAVHVHLGLAAAQREAEGLRIGTVVAVLERLLDLRQGVGRRHGESGLEKGIEAPEKPRWSQMCLPLTSSGTCPVLQLPGAGTLSEAHTLMKILVPSTVSAVLMTKLGRTGGGLQYQNDQHMGCILLILRTLCCILRKIPRQCLLSVSPWLRGDLLHRHILSGLPLLLLHFAHELLK